MFFIAKQHFYALSAFKRRLLAIFDWSKVVQGPSAKPSDQLMFMALHSSSEYRKVEVKKSSRPGYVLKKKPIGVNCTLVVFNKGQITVSVHFLFIFMDR